MTKLSAIHQRTLARIFLVLAAACMTAASCGDIAETRVDQPSCVVDEECEVGICFDGGCAAECRTDGDCEGEQICRSELRTDEGDVVDVCVADGSNGIDETECRTDDDCGEELARCGVDGFCFIPELSFGILVEDRTDASDEPLDGGAGADIAAIFLQNEAGEVVAWADTLDVQTANGVAIENAPAGSQRALTDDASCVDASFDEAATPLGGLGGYLLVRFVDRQTGNPVRQPEEGWSVVVVEWGENCPGGETGEPDRYVVFACQGPSFDGMNPSRDCVQQLGDLHSGRVILDAVEK